MGVYVLNTVNILYLVVYYIWQRAASDQASASLMPFIYQNVKEQVH